MVGLLLGCVEPHQGFKESELEDAQVTIPLKMATKNDAEFVVAITDPIEKALYVINEEALNEVMVAGLWPQLIWKQGSDFAQYQALPGDPPVPLQVSYKATEWLTSHDVIAGSNRWVKNLPKRTQNRDQFVGRCVDLDSKKATKRLEAYLRRIADDPHGLHTRPLTNELSARFVLRPYVYLIDDPGGSYTGTEFVADVRKLITYGNSECSVVTGELEAGRVWVVSHGAWPRP